jgi:glutamine synthetase type III
MPIEREELIRRAEERSQSLLERLQQKLAELQAAAEADEGFEDEFEWPHPGDDVEDEDEP